jgi:hypothetical protein
MTFANGNDENQGQKCTKSEVFKEVRHEEVTRLNHSANSTRHRGNYRVR